MNKLAKLKGGESVKVKPGVLDPDFKFDIGGWQGRVKDVDDYDSPLILWDSITLNSMDFGLIIKCKDKKLDWHLMVLDREEVEKTEHRDKLADVEQTINDIKSKIQTLNAEQKN